MFELWSNISTDSESCLCPPAQTSSNTLALLAVYQLLLGKSGSLSVKSSTVFCRLVSNCVCLLLRAEQVVLLEIVTGVSDLFWLLEGFLHKLKTTQVCL